MQPEYDNFISRMETFGVAAGMPPSVSRMLAYLTICQPAQQHVDEIRENIGLSAGAISEALTLLRSIGLVERFKKPGDRRFYYQLDPEGWRKATIRKFKVMDEGLAIAEEGLKILPNDPRMQSMHEMYELFSREFANFAERFK
jgi:DNA-binding transcriptional regulator GbsR (MarR family)